MNYQLPQHVINKIIGTGRIPILFDVDEVIHPMERNIKLFYHHTTGDESVLATLDDLAIDAKWKEVDFLPQLTNDEKLDLLDSEDFWDFAQPDPEAIKYIKLLQDDGYEIIFYTSHRPTGHDVKQAWLERNFPTVDFVLFASIHHPKDEYSGFMLVDDQIKHSLVNQSRHKVVFGLNRKIDPDQVPADAELILTWPSLYDFIKNTPI